MAEMIHYIAVFSLPDGEHAMNGWSESLKIAAKHVDQHILGRRRVLFPDEEAKLLNIRVVPNDKISEEIEKENARITAKYPDRLHVTEQFDFPNRIFDNRVTEESQGEAETRKAPGA